MKSNMDNCFEKALIGLKNGIYVKLYNGGIRFYEASLLSLIYYKYLHFREGYLFAFSKFQSDIYVEDYGITWALTAGELEKSEQEKLQEDLQLELFN